MTLENSKKKDKYIRDILRHHFDKIIKTSRYYN